MRLAIGGTLATLILFGGCDGSSKHAISTSEVVGTWTIALEEGESCDRNNPAPSLTVDLAVLGETGGTEMMLMGTWQLGPVTNPTLPLEGEIDLETGRFSAELWRESPTGSPTPEARGRLAGTIVDYGTLNGELVDPFGEASGILGAGSCRYAATGLR